MTVGIKSLRKIQLGLESASTPGTEVNATQIMYWIGTAKDDTKVEFSKDDVGRLFPTDRTWIPFAGGTLDVEGEATFEQLPYILTCGVLSCKAGTADGAGSGKIYEYTFANDAPVSIDTATLEFGDNVQEEQMLYSYVESFKLSGSGGEALKFNATWKGRQIATGSYTGALTPSTSVETIIFQKAKVYIDAGGSGTIGSTQASNTILGITYDCKKTGWEAPQTADGRLDYSFIKQVAPEIELELTFEHDATSVAEKAAWRAQTERLIRIDFLGSALTSAGTAHTYKTLRLDMAGKWESFEKIGEKDGNDIVTGKLLVRYGIDEALGPSITVVNQVASL